MPIVCFILIRSSLPCTARAHGIRCSSLQSYRRFIKPATAREPLAHSPSHHPTPSSMQRQKLFNSNASTVFNKERNASVAAKVQFNEFLWMAGIPPKHPAPNGGAPDHSYADRRDALKRVVNLFAVPSR